MADLKNSTDQAFDEGKDALNAGGQTVKETTKTTVKIAKRVQKAVKHETEKAAVSTLSAAIPILIPIIAAILILLIMFTIAAANLGYGGPGTQTNSGSSTSTQASQYTELGQKAYEGDTNAQQQIIAAIAQATIKEWGDIGYPRSIMIAQCIQETGWLSFPHHEDTSHTYIQPSDNNVMGMNDYLINSTSAYTGAAAVKQAEINYGFIQNTNWWSVQRWVPQYDDAGNVTHSYEGMCKFNSMEDCFCAYGIFRITPHPTVAGSTDYVSVIHSTLAHYATDSSYMSSLINIIQKYGLAKYDTEMTREQAKQAAAQTTSSSSGSYRTDPTNYTDDQIDLMCAVCAQECDTSYEGTLAVISCIMNRADINYSGYGTTAMQQLTAPGQFCYSPQVSSPSLWQKRLHGNYASFVKQAVTDCIKNGKRNHNFTSFRSTPKAGRVQIGNNYYFNEK